jgi:CRISPR system Cascade subunit CasC
MRLIELHILQSFPVSCLNRDDVGAPKTAVFGGASRARISSQCLKRAIRHYAKELEGTLYAAKRSRVFTPEVAKLLAADLPEEAEALARCAAHYLGRLDPTDDAKVKTLMFLSPEEYARLAKVLAHLPAEKRKELREATSRVNRAELEAEVTEDGGPEDLAVLSENSSTVTRPD